MISLDFAPNESGSDAAIALKLSFMPWKWRKGDGVTKVKRRLKQLFFHSSAQSILFLSGRGALYALIQNLVVRPGSTILVQGFTCEAVILPILALGYRVRYVDITSSDYSIDIDDLKKKYSSDCSILILQHTFGMRPRNRDQILAFAKKNNVIVIEDVAHGFESTLFKKKHTTHLLLSFGRSKSFSSVFGGAVVTCDPKLAKQLLDYEKKLSHATWPHLFKMCIYKPFVYLVKKTYDWHIGRIIHQIGKWLGLLIPELSSREKQCRFDSRMLKSYPNVLAQLLMSQLHTFNDVSAQRRLISTLYRNRLDLEVQMIDADYTRFPYLTSNRDEIIRRFKKNNIFLGNWYQQPVAPANISLDKMGYTHLDCPVAEEICRSIINLPTRISVAEAHKILDILKQDTT